MAMIIKQTPSIYDNLIPDDVRNNILQPLLDENLKNKCYVHWSTISPVRTVTRENYFNSLIECYIIETNDKITKIQYYWDYRLQSKVVESSKIYIKNNYELEKKYPNILEKIFYFLFSILKW